MASIVVRTRKDGSKSFQVRWREDGRWDSRTVHDEEQANDLKFILERTGSNIVETERLLAERHETGPTLTELMHDHIRHLTNVGPYMISRYKDYVRLYFADTIGDYKAAKLTHRDIVRWIKLMEIRGLSPKTISNLHGFLSATMTTAVTTGVREANPCKGVKLPKETSHKEKTTFLTKEEWAAIRDNLDHYYRPLFELLIGTGLRFGEAAALYADDFNLTSQPPTVRVAKAYKMDDKGGYYLGTPKTRKGVRTVSLAPSTIAAVLPLIQEAGSGHVFKSKRGQVIKSPTVLKWSWKPALKAAGIERNVRIHDLRHTHASWMLQAGLDMYTLSARLGHSSIQMSIDLYSHIMPDAQFAGSQAAARALGEIA